MTGYESKKAAANAKLSKCQWLDPTCCEYKCEQGRNCPVRAVNQAYVERGGTVEPDPYSDSVGTVQALISVIFVCGVVTLIFFLWGK